MARGVGPPGGSAAGASRGFAAYVLLSLVLVLVLWLDPLVDKPSGLIKLKWFTSRPLSHSLEPCGWDYEGSWAIGLAHGRPSPLQLGVAPQPAITCATVTNTSVSFVADPFLLVPPALGGALAAGKGGAAAAAAAAAALPPGAWYSFYEMKNLHRYIGEIGVAISHDQGATWRHLGTALTERFHLSYPLVVFDPDSSLFLMFAETIGAREGAIRVYGTEPASFPFGWRVVATKRPTDPGWPATRRWFHFGAPARYVDTSPVWYQGQWWIFTSRVGAPGAGQPKYTLLLYTAQSLLGEWVPHAAMRNGTRNPLRSGPRHLYGITADRRTARNGGRPFVLDGRLYRWAQDCSRYYGEALVLMRADEAGAASYRESEAVGYQPDRQPDSWHAQRLHHADVQLLANGTWAGFVDGDRYPDGYAHFLAREGWFIELKTRLLHLAALQLVLVATAAALLGAASAKTLWP